MIKNILAKLLKLRSELGARKLALPRTEEILIQPLPHKAALLEYLSEKHALTIFDIGACDCLDSIRYSRLFPNAKVFAFEPLPQNVVDARKLLKTHNMTSVTLVPVAIGSHCGKSKFFVSSGTPDGYASGNHWNFGNKSSSLLQPDVSQIQNQWSWLKFSRETTVPVTTLTNFCNENKIDRIHLAHVDVQGAELEVLRGAADIIDRIDLLWIEMSSQRFYCKQPLAEEVRDFLLKSNFNCVLKEGNAPQWDELWIRANFTPSVKQQHAL